MVGLDVDGVLNRGFGKPIPELVENVNWLCREAGASILFTSSWRLDQTLEQNQRMLRGFGIEAPVVGQTPEWDKLPQWSKNQLLKNDGRPTGRIVFGGMMELRGQEVEAFLRSLPPRGEKPKGGREEYRRWKAAVRGVEVLEWVDQQPEGVEGLVLIDDIATMEPLHNYLVKTDTYSGLTRAKAQEALEVIRRTFVWPARRASS